VLTPTIVELNNVRTFTIPVSDNVAVKSCSFAFENNDEPMSLSLDYCKSCTASISKIITIPNPFEAKVYCYDFAGGMSFIKETIKPQNLAAFTSFSYYIKPEMNWALANVQYEFEALPAITPDETPISTSYEWKVNDVVKSNLQTLKTAFAGKTAVNLTVTAVYSQAGTLTSKDSFIVQTCQHVSPCVSAEQSYCGCPIANPNCLESQKNSVWKCQPDQSKAGICLTAVFSSTCQYGCQSLSSTTASCKSYTGCPPDDPECESHGASPMIMKHCPGNEC